MSETESYESYLEVALLRAVNVRGHNTVKMPVLIDTLRGIPLPVKWIEYEGASASILFSNPKRIPESKLQEGIRAATGRLATVRSGEHLKATLQRFNQLLSNTNRSVKKTNSNVEVLSHGTVKACIGFLIDDVHLPTDVEYPKNVSDDVSVLGQMDGRDFYCLWIRKNGTYGNVSGAIERWLGAKATTRAYSKVYNIVCRLSR
ncbi:MAG: hypothetical protein WB643_12375 [Candidatus Bathyarchaeia archaeon]